MTFQFDGSMLRRWLRSLREVLGIYKSEFANIDSLLSIYESEPKARMLEKMGSGLLCAIPILLSVARSRSIRISTKTFWGERIDVMIPEGGSVSIATTGFLEPELTKWILRFVGDGMIAIDIGAHFGYYTTLLSHLVGPQGEVHAFEPTPSTFSMLRSNVRGRKNVFTNRLACFSHSGYMPLSDYGLRYSGFNSLVGSRMGHLRPERVMQVRTLRLDDYVNSKGLTPNFVKIDAESSEWEILRGMHEVITRHHPVISLEVGDFVAEAIPSRTLIQHLLDLGYDPLEATDGYMRRHKLQDRYGYSNILFIPRGGKL